jgi:hypothetical protein
MKSVLLILTAASVHALAPSAHAAPVTVDFDGLDGGRNVFLERPANFYNGGLGSMGSGPGPDYGITFLPIDATSTEPRAICNVTFQCDDGAGNSLFIFGDLQNGTERGTIMYIEGGFRGVVEFDASISNAGSGAYVTTRTDLSDLSNITLGVVRNPDPSDTCGRLECSFHHYSFNLADSPFHPDDVAAHYIIFYTAGDDALFVDNIRFHDLILPETPPTAVAEPSTALMIGGTGLIGAMLRRRRKAV